MIQQLGDFHHPFFIGIAGTGMSALAQYLREEGKQVSGSDRYFLPDVANATRSMLEAAGIRCFPQNGEGITGQTDLVVVSTAVEDTVEEVQIARRRGIPILHRAELLALIVASRRTLAIGGTSGKSTTTAMLFEILDQAGLGPGIISGAGLVSLIRAGKIGNARHGNGPWLVIEADESDGSIVSYHPQIGLLLNIDKDHKEIDVLTGLFGQFRDHCQHFVVNQAHPLARQLSRDIRQDFSADPDCPAGLVATGFRQEGLTIRFEVNGVPFRLNQVGRHNMENALAATAAAVMTGLSLEQCASALATYQGIYRRHQVWGRKEGVWLVDDYAHNPVKCAASIRACQPIAGKVVAWFQPHGYGPTKFLRKEFVEELARVLRDTDEIWMSEIFYAGGTAQKDISAADLVADLRALGKPAWFVADRRDFLQAVRTHLTGDCVLLLMGARDPSLEDFARAVWEEL
ncbi:MAG TPA: Mur ligase domain-containing protein [Chitinophagaceae bacterium]|nr:Mur ligase domain-containing protein [Chitinophagaceae bacterium]